MSSGEKSVELLQGTLDLIVLRALSTMGPLHAYALANPANTTDKTGQIAFLAVLLIAVAVGAVVGAIGAAATASTASSAPCSAPASATTNYPGRQDRPPTRRSHSPPKHPLTNP